MSKKCIICSERKPNEEFSPEHIIPKALGGDLTLDSVCQTCNNRMGNRVDHHLIDHWLVSYLRSAYEIEGQRGSIPNPLGKGHLKDNPDEEVEVDPNSENIVSFPPDVQQTPIENEQGEEGERVSIKIGAERKDQLVDIFNGLQEKYGNDPMDWEDLKEHAKIEKREDITAQVSVTIDLIRYQIGMIKIAFEYGYHLLGDDYRKDPVYNIYQNALHTMAYDNDFYQSWENDPEYPWDIKGSCKLSLEGSILTPLWQQKIPKYHPHSHVIFPIFTNGSTLCYINIFGAFEGALEISREIHYNKDNEFSIYREFPPNRGSHGDTLGNILSGVSLISKPPPRVVRDRSVILPDDGQYDFNLGQMQMNINRIEKG